MNKVYSNVNFKLQKKLFYNTFFETLDPFVTLGTDKHIEIFVQGIVTVPYYIAALSSVNVKRHFDFGNTRVIGVKYLFSLFHFPYTPLCIKKSIV